MMDAVDPTILVALGTASTAALAALVGPVLYKFAQATWALRGCGLFAGGPTGQSWERGAEDA
jgi:hypothetical protein